VLARSVAYNIMGQVATFAIGFVSSTYVARALGPSDRGVLAIMVTLPAIGLAFVSLGLPTAVMYYSSRRETSQEAVLGNSLAFGLGLGLLAIPIFWLARDSIGHAIAGGRGGGVWVLAGAFIPLTFLDWALTNQLLGSLKFGLFNVINVGSKLASLVLALVLLAGLGLGLGGAMTATDAIPVIDISVAAAILLRTIRPRFDLSLFRRMIGYGGRAQIGTLFHAVNMRFDVLILQAFAPLRVVGYYVVAQILSELVLYLGLAFQTSLIPLISRYDGEDRQERTSLAALRHHGLLSIFAVAGNAVLAPLVLVFAYGPGFRPALVPMFILLPTMWFLATGNVIAGDLSGRGRPGVVSVLTGSTAILTVIFDLALIPPFGVIGAATASALAYVFYGVLAVLAEGRIAGVDVREFLLPSRRDLAAYPAAVLSVLRGLGAGRAAGPASTLGSVRWLVEEIRDRRGGRVDDADLPAPSYRHPLGRVPAIERNGGYAFGTADACLDLAERHPESGLLGPPGSEERAFAYRWIWFATTELEPAIVQTVANRAANPELAAAASFQARRAAAYFEEALAVADYLVGGRFGVVDVVCGGVLAVGARLGLIAGSPSIEAYLERLESRPARKRAAGGMAATEPRAARPAAVRA